MKHFTPTAVIPSDATLNVSDAWAERFDQENERGEYVELLFTRGSESAPSLHPLGHGLFREREHFVDAYVVVGMTVEDTDEGPLYLDRAEVERRFGADWITKMEKHMDEAA